MERPESPRRFLSDEMSSLHTRRLQIECRLSAKFDAEVYRPKERKEGSIDIVAPNIARVLRQVDNAGHHPESKHSNFFLFSSCPLQEGLDRSTNRPRRTSVCWLWFQQTSL